jgi:hypothetical protein
MLERMDAREADPRTAVWVEEECPLEGAAPGAGPVEALVEVEEPRPEEMVVTAVLPRPGYLVVADRWAPGWRVLVDGMPRTLYRGDYLFRVVPLDEGRHTVRFLYRQPLLREGLVVTLTGAVVALALGLFGLGAPAARGGLRGSEGGRMLTAALAVTAGLLVLSAALGDWSDVIPSVRLKTHAAAWHDESAGRHMRAGDAAAAAGAWRSAVALAPHRADLHFKLAGACLETGDAACARAHLERAVALRPSWEEAARLREALEDGGE